MAWLLALDVPRRVAVIGAAFTAVVGVGWLFTVVAGLGAPTAEVTEQDTDPDADVIVASSTPDPTPSTEPGPPPSPTPSATATKATPTPSQRATPTPEPTTPESSPTPAPTRTAPPSPTPTPPATPGPAGTERDPDPGEERGRQTIWFDDPFGVEVSTQGNLSVPVTVSGWAWSLQPRASSTNPVQVRSVGPASVCRDDGSATPPVIVLADVVVGSTCAVVLHAAGDSRFHAADVVVNFVGTAGYTMRWTLTAPARSHCFAPGARVPDVVMTMTSPEPVTWSDMGSPFIVRTGAPDDLEVAYRDGWVRWTPQPDTAGREFRMADLHLTDEASVGHVIEVTALASYPGEGIGDIQPAEVLRWTVQAACP